MAGEADVDYASPGFWGTYEGLISGGPSVPLAFDWPHARICLDFHSPSHFSPKVNSVTGRKKAPLDWRSRCLDVGPGPGLHYPWQGGNQHYLTMEAARPIKCCRIPGCRCGPTEGNPATTLPWVAVKCAFYGPVQKPPAQNSCTRGLPPV